MEKFKIKPGGFKEIKKQVLKKLIPFFIVIMAVSMGISYLDINHKSKHVNVMLEVVIGITIVFGVGGFGIFRAVNRLKHLFESYTLTITDNSVIREQHNTLTITLLFSDINQIIKNSNGSFTIKGRNALDVIGVPVQIENYEQLETSLNQIRPLAIKTQEAISQKLRVPLSFLALGLMATVYLATNKIIVGISGVIVSGLLIWSLIQIQQNKNIDSKTKRGSYWSIFALVSIIAMTIYKLLGN
ncbi:MAG: hypothetical protein ABI723_11365 [Bacteroidia bacterium]